MAVSLVKPRSPLQTPSSPATSGHLWISCLQGHLTLSYLNKYTTYSATRQTYLLISTWPEDGHEEYSCDRRHQKAGHWLHVVKQQSTIWCLDDWNPQEADTHQDQNENPATSDHLCDSLVGHFELLKKKSSLQNTYFAIPLVFWFHIFLIEWHSAATAALFPTIWGLVGLTWEKKWSPRHHLMTNRGHKGFLSSLIKLLNLTTWILIISPRFYTRGIFYFNPSLTFSLKNDVTEILARLKSMLTICCFVYQLCKRCSSITNVSTSVLLK